MTAVLAVVLFLFPALAVYGAKRSKLLAALSPVVLCYGFGILLGNTGLFPPDSPAADLADTVSVAMVALAIPLLLFGTDFRRWLKIARPTVISFGLAIVAIVVVSVVGALLFPDVGGATWRVAGMAVGVYTGGTANMAAIGTAVGVEEATFVALNAADVVLGAVYLLFLMTIAARVIGRFLPPFESNLDPDEAEELETDDDPWAFRPPVGAVLKGLGAALVVLLLAAAAAYGVAALVSSSTEGLLDSDAFATGVVLGITTLGIAASFVRPVHQIPGTYEMGQYGFLVFAAAIGTLANIGKLAESLTTVAPFLASVLTAAIVLHYLLAKLFGIDRDTAIITSTAAVFGPPFVGPIAAVLRNREIVVSGLATGVVGLAVGNYAGLAVAYLLRP